MEYALFLVTIHAIQGFAESLQHCIRPQSSVTSLYVKGTEFLKLPYTEGTV